VARHVGSGAAVVLPVPLSVVVSVETGRLLHARLAADHAGLRLPSVTAGLVRGGALVWTGGCGGVDGTVPGPDVQYRCGSITKTFVAVAVLRLRDAGRVELSDPVGRHIDAGAAAELTVGQLLSHTSGVRAETAGPWWERTPGVPLAALIEESLGADGRRLRPGRMHHYSNVGYALLGQLVATLSGTSWDALVKAELLEPLGMTRTTTRPRQPHATGLAVHPHAGLVLREPEHDAVAMAPAGQLWTTVADLARWAGFLAAAPGCGEGLLPASTLAEMREVAAIVDVPGQPWAAGYGLGLQLWNNAGRRSYGHTGAMPGFVAELRIDAATGDAAIVMANSTAGFGAALAGDLLDLLAEHEPADPRPVAKAAAPPALDLTGTWYWGPAPFVASLTGAELEFRAAGPQARAFRFRQGGDGVWTGIDGYFAAEPITPVRHADGQIIALDIASHLYTRAPYDPRAPIPGGLDPDGWQPGP
jgi:CubicO group peptidase (beta-lactamase class C family)